MRAVVKATAGPGAEIREVPLPTCGPRDLLLKVKRAGVCGTDLHIYEWDRWSQGRMRPPVTIGHEFVGEIVQVGHEVESLQTGELVSCESHIVCGHCLACRTGHGHVCENT
ncbi:MAG: alcohol dehydrogenase catalytic domain-containing protein, partial [Candidatus Eisenbacteria bacterium]